MLAMIYVPFGAIAICILIMAFGLLYTRGFDSMLTKGAFIGFAGVATLAVAMFIEDIWANREAR